MFKYVDALDIKDQLARKREFAHAIAQPRFSSDVGRLWELEQERTRLLRNIEVAMIQAASKTVIKSYSHVSTVTRSSRMHSWINELVGE